MKVWYYDIPPGIYTTKEIMNLAEPRQTYQCVHSAFRRLKVKSFRIKNKNVGYNKRNEKVWKWEGAEFYLKIVKKEK